MPCSMLLLIGGHGTIRNLTFEYMDVGMQLGLGTEGVTPGGYRIEGNTFRNSSSGVRAGFLSADPTVIRGNRFINMFHAVFSTAGSLHVLDNDISVPEPERTRPPGRHPGSALALGGEHNVTAGNRIEGHPDGVRVIAGADRPARHNVIRDNTIIVRRVTFASSEDVVVRHEHDSAVVGIPLALDNPNGEAILENNLIEGNRILGAQGLGVEIRHGSRNRILNNTITGVKKRDPFPGNTLGGDPQGWREANGSGIWVSPGSEENEIVGNIFDQIASHAIVLEGDRNRVNPRSARDTVRDTGNDNRVSKPR